MTPLRNTLLTDALPPHERLPDWTPYRLPRLTLATRQRRRSERSPSLFAEY